MAVAGTAWSIAPSLEEVLVDNYSGLVREMEIPGARIWGKIRGPYTHRLRIDQIAYRQLSRWKPPTSFIIDKPHQERESGQTMCNQVVRCRDGIARGEQVHAAGPSDSSGPSANLALAPEITPL